MTNNTDISGLPQESKTIDKDGVTHGHNTSYQHNVDVNPDLALHYSHEHQHEHIHHGRTSLSGRKESVEYARGVTDHNRDLLSKPPQNYATHTLRDEKGPIYTEGDAEKGGMSPTRVSTEEERYKKNGFAAFYRKYKLVFHVLIWLLFLGWWIAGLIVHRDYGWLKPFLLFLAISIRILTLWVPISLFWNPVKTVWGYTAVKVYEAIPAKLRQPLAAVGTVAVVLVGTFASREVADNTRANRAVSLFGIVVALASLYATSRKRSKINWHTVIGGMLTQFVIALFVLRTKAGYDIFDFISYLARALLGFANQGTAFLLADSVVDLHWFATGVLPPIVFFVALVQVLYYIGLLQWFIVKFAKFFFWTLRISGAEAVVASATPFIGQGESAMLVRPFVPHMTRAELHQVMTCGFATIAGSVLVAYIGLGLNGQALVSSCIMSIPASLAVSKMRYPEEEETITSGRVVVPDDDEHKASNAIHAFANGAWLGIKIAGMILATLLCIVALVGLINGLLGWWGSYLGINDPKLSLEMIFGYICYPIAFLLGVPRQDVRVVGKLIGMKIVINEYAAFHTMKTVYKGALAPRSEMIATYALCGFGNFGSLGTQIGVLSQIAPSRSGDVAKLAVSALITGIIATLTSAAVAGLVVTDQFAPEPAF